MMRSASQGRCKSCLPRKQDRAALPARKEQIDALKQVPKLASLGENEASDAQDLSNLMNLSNALQESSDVPDGMASARDSSWLSEPAPRRSRPGNASMLSFSHFSFTSLQPAAPLRRSAGYPSVQEGFVWKRSAWRKTWARRYLVLGQDGLFSYRGRGEVSPSLQMLDVMDCAPTELAKNDYFGLRIRTARGVFDICMASTAEREAWICAIREQLLGTR